MYEPENVPVESPVEEAPVVEVTTEPVQEGKPSDDQSAAA
jgi:hypothetical protein